jgi:membrane protein implicated in regulation of membrane protease activity
MRPTTFWTLIAGAMFATMTALWAFSDDEPTGVLLWVSGIGWWVSGIALVVLATIGLARFRRPEKPSGTTGKTGRRSSASSRRTRLS